MAVAPAPTAATMGAPTVAPMRTVAAAAPVAKPLRFDSSKTSRRDLLMSTKLAAGRARLQPEPSATERATPEEGYFDTEISPPQGTSMECARPEPTLI